MIETREKKIRNSVFSKTDISNIWAIFNSEFFKSKELKNSANFSMQVQCADGTRYESETNELLSEGNIFDLKKIESIDFTYYDYTDDVNKRIVLDLTHGTSTYNKLTVRGADKNWVAGIFSDFENILNAVKPQHSWFVKYQTSVFIIATVIFGNFFLNIILNLYPSYLGNSTKLVNIIFNYVLGIFPFLLIGLIFSGNLVSWVVKLWPNIEFDFGPEHKKIEKNKRERIWIFITVLIVPLLFTLLSQVI